MNKRIRMMEKAFPSFRARKYFSVKDKTQIQLREFVVMLRKGMWLKQPHTVKE